MPALLSRASICCRVLFEQRSSLQVDATFAATEALQPLPRLVYALLQAPPLQPASATAQSLEAAEMRALLCSLGPDDCAMLLYPALSSWATPDSEVLHPCRGLQGWRSACSAAMTNAASAGHFRPLCRLRKTDHAASTAQPWAAYRLRCLLHAGLPQAQPVQSGAAVQRAHPAAGLLHQGPAVLLLLRIGHGVG